MYFKSVATPVSLKSSWLEWRGEGKERSIECKSKTTKLFGELKISKKGKKGGNTQQPPPVTAKFLKRNCEEPLWFYYPF